MPEACLPEPESLFAREEFVSELHPAMSSNAHANVRNPEIILAAEPSFNIAELH